MVKKKQTQEKQTQEKQTQEEQTQEPKQKPALEILRKSVGLSQAQLAQQIPDKTRTKTIHQSVISNWETGKDEPELTITQIKALCRALKKTLDEIPEDLGPPK